MNKKIKNTVICVSMAVILFSLSALCVFMPKDDFLDAERRKPAEFPEFTLDSVMKDGTEYSESFMSKFEKYAVDAFPFRDSFRTLKALFSNYVVLQKDNNGIYLADGYASKLDYPLKDDIIEHAASRFEYIYKTSYLHYLLISGQYSWHVEPLQALIPQVSNHKSSVNILNHIDSFLFHYLAIY